MGSLMTLACRFDPQRIVHAGRKCISPTAVWRARQRSHWSGMAYFPRISSTKGSMSLLRISTGIWCPRSG